VLRDLVVLSHLRWDFVWQRPQHLMTRLANSYRRVWFVEEPREVEGAARTVMRTQPDGAVVRCWLEGPPGHGHTGFNEAVAPAYAKWLTERLAGRACDAWLYTPMALTVATAIRPVLTVYDVMDDLSSFRFAPEGVKLRQRQAIRAATVVFTGGRTLHAGVLTQRQEAVYCFPSGVDVEHYRPASLRRRARPPGAPVAGYVGVIDERLDMQLLADLADGLPDWEIRMVGPVVKISDSELPRRPNLRYVGPVTYDELPDTMGGFDVGLMPFALNDATRSISPTKSLEYLAAGLPVVSTRVRDVVTDLGAVVDLRDDGAGFADACRAALSEPPAGWRERVHLLLQQHDWDNIATTMAARLERARTLRPTTTEATA
jgi:glycosyltransferase involved in cell wall biosynthesis